MLTRQQFTGDTAALLEAPESVVLRIGSGKRPSVAPVWRTPTSRQSCDKDKWPGNNGRAVGRCPPPTHGVQCRCLHAPRSWRVGTPVESDAPSGPLVRLTGWIYGGRQGRVTYTAYPNGLHAMPHFLVQDSRQIGLEPGSGETPALGLQWLAKDPERGDGPVVGPTPVPPSALLSLANQSETATARHRGPRRGRDRCLGGLTGMVSHEPRLDRCMVIVDGFGVTNRSPKVKIPHPPARCILLNVSSAPSGS